MTIDQIQWLTNPEQELRKHPNDTALLMKAEGTIYFCHLSGNLPSDQRWKFRRLPDRKCLDVERMVAKGAAFALIGQETQRED